jgi:ABC-type nickel/cobalt efflux system permease component RcnA
MLRNGKLLLAAVFALLAIFVDFTSKLLSVVSDGLLIGVAGFLIYQVVKSPKKG